MKKILFIGAGLLQSFIIKRAKELGYYTIAVDKNPNSVGFQYCDDYSQVDIIDKQKCLEYAKIKKIDGVLTVATDYGVLSASYIAREMNLPGLSYDVAKVIKNKYKVRKIFVKENVDDVSQCYEIENYSDLELIKDRLKYPLIVKPCDGSGSKGINKVISYEQLKDACNEAIQYSIVSRALVEDFIDGKEIGVESFVYNNEIYILGILDKKMTSPPNYAELGHSTFQDHIISGKVKNVVRKAIKALGINFGAVNMDILISKDNKITIIDVGARMGGNLIGSHIIPISTGIDYMEILIKSALGENISISEMKKVEIKKQVVTRILALSPGVIMTMPDLKELLIENELDVIHRLEVKKVIKKYRTNLDGNGYIIARSNSISEAEEKAEIALCTINESIVRR